MPERVIKFAGLKQLPSYNRSGLIVPPVSLSIVPGPKVPFIPVIGTFYPNESGVDVTFENEKEEYRASFFIRAYKYEEKGEVVSTPRYLWEDLFSYGSFFGNGLHIKWVDAPENADVTIETDVRYNLKDGNGSPDTKPWRFYRSDILDQ